MKPHVDLWEYFNGVEDRLWKYSEWVEDEFWKLILKVEEWLIDLIESIYWLHHCQKNFYLDLLKYFNGVEDRLLKYSERIEDKFWKLTSKVGEWLIDMKTG